MTRIRLICLSVSAALLVASGWIMWRIHLPHSIITSYWPVETYYSVHAEIELDGQPQTLDGVGRCDWQWNLLPQLNMSGKDVLGRTTHHGGFLTKVLADGRALIIFPGHYCYGGHPGLFNQRDVFFEEIDLLTGEERYPNGTRREIAFAGKELPRIVVLDDARAPKSIRYYPAPKATAASGCGELRFRSYRVAVTSSGEITHRELDVPYLANLEGQDRWIGYTARVVPFSALMKFPQMADFVERPPPIFTNFANAEAVKRWKHWFRELRPDTAPAREIAWDRENRTMTLPPRFLGDCAEVTTLYPAGTTVPNTFAGLTIVSESDTISQGKMPQNGFMVDDRDRILFSVQSHPRVFSPSMFGPT